MKKFRKTVICDKCGEPTNGWYHTTKCDKNEN